MENFLPSLNNYDYVIRTNLSSFYYFPNLLKYLKTLPKEKCYNAVVGYYDGQTFGGGAGIIFSRDVVELMIMNKSELSDYSSYPDDVAIAKFLRNYDIEVTPAPRVDIYTYSSWVENMNTIPSDAFHFRFKNAHDHLRLTEEVQMQKEALLNIIKFN